MMRQLLLVVVLAVVFQQRQQQQHGQVLVSAAAAATTTAATESMFQNLGPSMMACMSQGTTMAVPCWIENNYNDNNNNNKEHDTTRITSTTTVVNNRADGVLILMRTPAAEAVAGQEQSTTNHDNDGVGKQQQDNQASSLWICVGDLRVQPCRVDTAIRNRDNDDDDDYSKRWQILTPHAVVCCTGFSPEVHVMQRILQVQVEQHVVVYGDDATVSPPIAKLMHHLALVLSNAALSRTGRPFGVAVLAVGRQARTRTNNNKNNKNNGWQLWTVDPAGNLASHVGAAVIGKQAPAIQLQLIEEEEDPKESHKKESGDNDNAENNQPQTKDLVSPNTLLTPRQALTRMLRACITVDGGGTSATTTTRDGYQAVLLQWRNGAMQVGKVSRKDVQECLESLLDTYSSRKH